VDRFKSKYFRVLPKKSEILSQLSKLIIGKIDNIYLFEYSSCSAVFCVEVVDKNNKQFKIVIRGEQQSGNVQRPENSYSLEKEIVAYKLMLKLGLNVPNVLFNSKIFSVPGYDEKGMKVKNFNFFFMSYVEGIAVDKKIKIVDDYEKLILLNKVSSIMAKVHSVKGKEYGFIDQYKNASFHTDTIDGFLNALHSITIKLLKGNIGDEFAREVSIFMKDKIFPLSYELKNSGYSPQISLVLFDGSAGNMLINDKNIQIIDLVNLGFFEPLTDFCAHFFCMKDILISSYKGKRFWDHFVESYKAHGGILPSEPYLTQLFHIINVYFLCDAIIGYKTHSGSNKREKTNELIEATRRVMSLVSPNISDIAEVL
tara:strand:- start:2944 stop:4050 length:1107 start_codon:yes stop_codon:yes gene_type:complete